MSKHAQRKVSAFSAGRSARRIALQVVMVNPFNRSNGLRKVWNAGWKEEHRIICDKDKPK